MDDLFDGKEGDRLKREGMALAAGKRMGLLQMARAEACEIGKQKRLVTADDVGRVMKSMYGIESIGPATGSLFKTRDWEWTGQWKKSVRKTNHSRMIRIWRYIGR